MPLTFRQTFTNRDITDRAGMTIDQVKRNVKDLLPSGGEIGSRSGTSREHSPNEAFFVFVGHYLVNNLGLSVKDAKNIFNDIKPWLERENLLPESGVIKPDYYKFMGTIPVDYDEETGKVTRWEDDTVPAYNPYVIEIMRATGTSSGFFYKTVKILERKSVLWNKLQAIQTHTLEGTIIPPPRHMVCDQMTIFRLPISDLLNDFRSKFNVLPAL